MTSHPSHLKPAYLEPEILFARGLPLATKEERPEMTQSNLISTIHSVLHTELTLDRPLSEVWPVFKDMRSWYTEYAWEVISGPPYETGVGLLEDQVLRVKSSHPFPRVANAGDSTGPEYFVTKILKIVPQREIVSVLSGRAYDWRQYTSFYVWKMTEAAAKTTILIDVFGEAELETPLSKQALSKYQDELTSNWYRSWSTAFGNLKRIMNADN
jgi:hypothetical protein